MPSSYSLFEMFLFPEAAARPVIIVPRQLTLDFLEVGADEPLEQSLRSKVKYRICI